MVDKILKKTNLMNGLYVSFGTIINSLFYSLFLLLISKVLMPDDYGIFISSISFMVFLSMLALFGSESYWLKLHSSNEIKKIKESSSLSLNFIKINVLTIAVFFTIIININFLDDKTQSSLLSIFPVFIFLIILDLTNSLLQIKSMFKTFFILQSTINLIRFLLFLIFIFFETNIDLKQTALFYFLTIIPQFFYCLYFLSKESPLFLNNLKGNKINLENLKRLFKFDIKKFGLFFFQVKYFGYVNILAFLRLYFPLFYVKSIYGNFEAGIYSVFIIFYNIVSFIPASLYSKMFTFTYHKTKKKSLERLFYRANTLLFIFGIFVSLVFFIFIYFFFDLLFDISYHKAKSLLYVVAFFIPIKFIGFNPGAILVTNKMIKIKMTILKNIFLLMVFFILLFLLIFFHFMVFLLLFYSLNFF